MGNRVFGERELSLPGQGYALHDGEGRLLASGGFEELKAYLACNDRDHAHPHLSDGKYHIQGPGADSTFHKHEGEVYHGGDECVVRSVALKNGEEPDPCSGPPIHPVEVFEGRLGAVATHYVCPGHRGVMDEMYRRTRGGSDRSATQDN
jgi:hypothetical protein